MERGVRVPVENDLQFPHVLLKVCDSSIRCLEPTVYHRFKKVTGGVRALHRRIISRTHTLPLRRYQVVHVNRLPVLRLHTLLSNDCARHGLQRNPHIIQRHRGSSEADNDSARVSTAANTQYYHDRTLNRVLRYLLH